LKNEKLEVFARKSILKFLASLRREKKRLKLVRTGGFLFGLVTAEDYIFSSFSLVTKNFSGI